MQKKRFIKSQSGRSMVEVLGVLSIVGILAVSGITGYQYAMRRYRIAETYDEVSVTVGGGRTWPILEHYGPMTELIGVETVSTVAYVVPVREVVSKVNYRSNITAEEAGIEEPNDAADAMRFYNERREYESFTSKVYAPVWTRAETKDAWSVRVTGLSYELCEMIVTKRELGYDYVYPAFRDDAGAPMDPHYHDFPLVEDKYTNEDIKNYDNVKKLCEAIDPKHSGMPPVYTFIKDFKTLNKEGSKITSVADNGECSGANGMPSVRCLAYHARVDEQPLQTLVLYWGKTEDSPPPLQCTPGTQYDFTNTPTQQCCETETGGSWINGVCCELKPDGTCTGNDIEGNPNPNCVTPPIDDEQNCCIKGTPWFKGDINKLLGTCKGDCPQGPSSQTVPDQTEAQQCCEMQAGGRWVLKPGNRSSIIPPKSSNPKTSPRTQGGALCCATSSTVLQFNNSNPMSCSVPNTWSKVKISPLPKPNPPVYQEFYGVKYQCVTPNTGGGGGTTSDTGDVTCSNRVNIPCTSDACCQGECGKVSTAYLISDGVCCCDAAGGTTGGGTGTGGGVSSNAFAVGSRCEIEYVEPPRDIYGQVNTDCCEQQKKDGYIQMKPYVAGTSRVSQLCCEAMSEPNRTTPQKTGTVFVRGVASINDSCRTECCDGGEIQKAYQAYQNNPQGKYKGDIFVNVAGQGRADMCCQALVGSLDSTGSASDASKFMHPACCEVDLAFYPGDEPGRWADKKTLTVTEYDEADGVCTMKTVDVNATCCHPTVNGQDIHCADNLGCCDATNGYNNPNNMNSPLCCKLIPYHHWDNATGKCVSCTPDNSCGDPQKCSEVDDETCCIKNQGTQCFAPYAWNPKTGSVYITEKCCPDCPKDVATKGPFLGFTKSAKELDGRIVGDCYAGFGVR